LQAAWVPGAETAVEVGAMSNRKGKESLVVLWYRKKILVDLVLKIPDFFHLISAPEIEI
jgi:hypothetical protein